MGSAQTKRALLCSVWGLGWVPSRAVCCLPVQWTIREKQYQQKKKDGEEEEEEEGEEHQLQLPQGHNEMRLAKNKKYKNKKCETFCQLQLAASDLRTSHVSLCFCFRFSCCFFPCCRNNRPEASIFASHARHLTLIALASARA